MSDFSEYRLEICRACPYNMDSTCILCGCDILQKIQDRNESCPKVPKAWDIHKEPKPIREAPLVQLGGGGVSSTATKSEPAQGVKRCGSCQPKTR